MQTSHYQIVIVTLYHKVYKLLLLDKNILYHVTVCKQIITDTHTKKKKKKKKKRNNIF